MTETLQEAGSLGALIGELQQVLDKHPLGPAFQMLLVQDQVEKKPEEVVVQERVGESIELVKRSIHDLDENAIFHAASVVDINTYDQSRSAKCLVRYDLQGNPIHIYD